MFWNFLNHKNLSIINTLLLFNTTQIEKIQIFHFLVFQNEGTGESRFKLFASYIFIDNTDRSSCRTRDLNNKRLLNILLSVYALINMERRSVSRAFEISFRNKNQ